MHHKLLTDIPGDEFDLIRSETQLFRQIAEKTIRKKVFIGRGKNNLIPYKIFGQKNDDRKNDHGCQCPDYIPPKLFQVIQKGHFLADFVFHFRWAKIKAIFGLSLNLIERSI